MTRPGLRIRAFCARLCRDRTMRRLIDPALADLQVEHAAAHCTGSRARVIWTLAAGYLAIAKLLLIAGCGDAATRIRSWQPAERAGLRRGAWIALTIVIVLTALLEAPIFSSLELPDRFSDWGTCAQLALYLVPSALPLSLPVALVVAGAWLLHGAARTRKVAAAVLVAAALASAAMLVNIGWVVPDANQAFRQRVLAELMPDRTPVTPRRGLNELSWTEAQQRRQQVRAQGHAHEVRSFETWYYRRFALSLWPLAAMTLMVTIAFRRPWTRARLTGVALGVCAVNYALLMSALWVAGSSPLPPIVLGWSADAVCVVATLLLAFGSRAGGASESPPAPTR